MAGRIPQHFIDELLARVDIVEVIDEHVTLKKAGKEHKACCPFHNEKTPSFTVVPDKQFYHCFGCGAHGSAIGFLMDYAHMDFVEAVETLARRTGMDVPREGGEREDAGHTRLLLEMLEEANSFYAQQLRHAPDASRAVDYLKGRGLSGEVAAQYQLGYAPPGWDNLLRALGRDEDARKLLQGAGLLIEGEPGRYYDRFRDRIVFPIHDTRGRVVGFGGRILAQGEPKYLNTPETPVFHKGRELYGLYQARKANRSLDRLLVVEGYMDVVALAQFGVSNAVATLGTAATGDHVQRLFRSTPDVVFCFDGDEAGRRAAWRALENTLPVLRDGRQACFMFLPENEDPDSLVRKHGADGFNAALAEAAPLSRFFFDQLIEQLDPSTEEGRSRLVAEAQPLLERLPHGAFQRLMAKRLAELSGDEESSTLYSRGVRAASRPAPAKTGKGATTPVRRAITLLLHHPQLAVSVGQGERLDIDALPGGSLLVELIEITRANPNLTTGAILERFRAHAAEPHLVKLAANEVLEFSDGLQMEFDAALERLRRVPDERRYEELKRKARESGLGGLSAEERREFSALAGELPRDAGRR